VTGGILPTNAAGAEQVQSTQEIQAGSGSGALSKTSTAFLATFGSLGGFLPNTCFILAPTVLCFPTLNANYFN
jgi:hypothetical protein